MRGVKRLSVFWITILIMIPVIVIGYFYIFYTMDIKLDAQWMEELIALKTNNYYKYYVDLNELKIQTIEHDLANNANNIAAVKTQFVIASLMVFSTLFVLLFLNTRGLKKLSSTALEVASGNLNTRANLKGNSEVAILGTTFDKMVTSYETQIEYLEESLKKSKAFEPSDLFYTLNKKGILAVSLGDTTELSALVLTINRTQYKMIEKTMQEEIFRYMNRYLSTQIACITSAKAFVRTMEGGSVEGVFLNENKLGIIDLSIILLQKLEGDSEDFYIAIVDENIKVGMIGSKERSMLAVLSEVSDLSRNLQEMASKNAIPILITGQATNQIPDFNKRYKIRVIGYIYLEIVGKTEILYEILEGNSQKRLRIKLDTKEIFEQGVDFYSAREFKRAMKRFIQVKARDPKDTIASYYICLCEEQISENIKEHTIYLDKF